LLNLPPYLSQCFLVQNQLFGIHEGDVETDDDPRTNSTNNNINHQLEPTVTATSIPTPFLAEEPAQPMTTQTSTGTIKVEIIHKDDIIAIKVPLNSTLDALQSKINDRLGMPTQLQYKADATKDPLPLESEFDLEEAFAVSIKLGKLTVYANDLQA
jgi:bud emergence protein 1